ncbi:MAG TPA: hypothetical protein VEX15_24135 [Nocardioidaceae bacterium]|nr:hypothetical protein [Nocardioidaceae bacterium]
MPKSRTNRRVRRPHDHLRVKAKAEGRVRPPDVDPRVWRAVRAEAHGDAATALELLSDGDVDDDHLHRQDLGTLVRVGDHAPRWLIARWLTRQALRWLRLTGDERYERSLYLSLQGTYWCRADLAVADLPPAYAQALADDWVTREVALYGYRALDDFLDQVADKQLVDRGGSVRSWTRMPLQAHLLGPTDGDCLTATELTTGFGYDVVDLSDGSVDPAGAYVLGRLVPAGGELSFFECLPLPLDEQTAVDIATACSAHSGDPLPWAHLLTRAIDQGRLPRMPGAGLRTPIIADVAVGELPDVDWEPPPDQRYVELAASGLDAELVGWVQVLEAALPELPDSPAAMREAVGAVERILPSEAAMAVVREHLTGHEIADGWEALATYLEGEPRRISSELAATARAHA